ncbi:MAG: cysteine hydrolase family protein [Acidimicrobiia bacterium]|nr:cysteine hydrolase family protein [Acidimicrobiia bacterium]
MSPSTPFGPVAGTEPYPWPWPGEIDRSAVAVVLAGWDTHWAARSVGDCDGAVERLDALVVAALAADVPVIGLAHPPPPRAMSAWPDPVPLGGVGIASVAAGGIGGFSAGPLDGVLRAEGRTHLLVAGHGLEGPVHSTLRSANDRGYECLLVADACTPLTIDAAASAAHSVTMSGGIFGAVGSTADVIDALARHPNDPTS